MNLLQRLAGKGRPRSQHDPSWDTRSAPPRIGAWSSHAGAAVTLDSAMSIAAAGSAVRFKAGITGMTPLLVYRGDGPGRDRARDSWQYMLLHDKPHPDFTPFDFFEDLSTALDTQGDGFVWKVKPVLRNGRMGRVEALVPVDPRWVRVHIDERTGRRLYDVLNGKEIVTVDSSTLLQIRGWTPNPGWPRGMSAIEQYRHDLGHTIAKQEYIGKFFANDARPGGVIQLPQGSTADDAEQNLEIWEENHRGPSNAHRPGVLFNGATWQNTQFKPADLQFLESQRLDLETIARIFRVPPSLLYMTLQGQDVSVATEALRFEKFDAGPHLKRIQDAFRNDEDLFDGTDLFPEFLSDAWVKPDLQTRYNAYRLARQGGWVTANEIRERENLPRVEGGDQIQETPVGGAPNDGGTRGPKPEDTQSREDEETLDGA